MNSLAPIVIFTYKRLNTLQSTIDALRKNYYAKDSDLIIFSDAAKDEKDSNSIIEVRKYLKTIQGFNSIEIYEAYENKGLANSVIDGISKVFENNESIIVLEDDLITTPNFLAFMNQAIKEFKNEKKVFSICGYSFDFAVEGYSIDSFFLNRSWPWGWASWKDRWEEIDWSMHDYDSFKVDKKSRKQFSALGSDVNAMLDKQMNGQIDSWAIRWTYHQFKTNKISLFPVKSLVYNAGFDQYATHTTGSQKRYIPKLDDGKKTNFHFPVELYINSQFQKKFNKKMGIIARIKSKIESLLQKKLKIFFKCTNL
jgi:hypothetical protein